MKKRIICFILILIVAIGGGIGAYILTEANKGVAQIEDSEAKFKTTLKETPTDGSLPTDYSSLDNIAYALWKIQNTDEFKTITTGKSDASVATIQIYNQRIVKNKKAMVSTVSSGMISSGKQKYFQDNKVLLRDADKINGFDTTWKTGQPECISNKAYITRYGWLPFQCTGYIICEDTILNASELICNEDGTFAITLEMNPDSDYAPFWYRREVLTNASSTMEPQFKMIQISYTFDTTWRILESRIKEEYKVKSMGIEATSKTDCTEVFSYENIEFNEYEYQFFKQYESLMPKDSEEAPTIIEDDVLTMITSSLQNQDGSDKNLGLSLMYNDIELKGIAALKISDLKNVKVKAKLDDLYIEYSDAFYLSLGGLNIKANMSTLKNLFSNLSNKESGLALDASQIISDLNQATIIKSDDGKDIKVNANLNLFDIDLPLYFHFSKIDENYTLLDASTELQLENNFIHVKIYSTDEKLMEVDKANFQEFSNLQFLFDEIFEIIDSKKVSLHLNGQYKDMNLNVDAKIDFSKEIQGQVLLNIGNADAHQELLLTYSNQSIYLDFAEQKLKIAKDDLLKLLEECGITIDAPSMTLNEIIEIVFAIDYSKLLKEILINEENISIKIGLTQFIENMKDITIRLSKEHNGLGISLDVFDINGVIASGEFNIDVKEEDYQNIGYLDYVMDGILGMIDSKQVHLEFSGNHKELSIYGNAYADFNKETKACVELNINYKDISMPFVVHYFDLYVQQDMVLEKVILINFNEIYAYVTLNNLMEYLPNQNLDINVFKIEDLINVVLSLDFIQLIKNITIEENKTSISLNLSEVLENLNSISLEIARENNGLNFDLNIFDLNVKLYNTLDKEITGDVTKEYIPVKELIDEVFLVAKWIGNKSFSISATGDVYLNVNEEKQKIHLELGLDFVLVKDSYDVDGVLCVTMQEMEVLCNFQMVNEFIYITLLGQTFQIPKASISSILNEIVKGIDLKDKGEISLASLQKVLDSITINDKDMIQVNLTDTLSKLSLITIHYSVNKQEEHASISIEDNKDIFDVYISAKVLDKTEVQIPTENIVSFTKEEIEYLCQSIKNIIYQLKNSNGVTLNLNATIYGITLFGEIKVTKEFDVYATLIAKMIDENNIEKSVTIHLKYVNHQFYLEWNGLNIVFKNQDFDTILNTIKEVLNEIIPESNEEHLIDVKSLIDGLTFTIVDKGIHEDVVSLGVNLGIGSFEDINFLLLVKENIDFTLNLNSEIKINSLELNYGVTGIPPICEEDYLEVSNLIDLFTNLEQGISSTGELSVMVMGYDIRLPYDMQFKFDLVELIKGENVFKSIELELTITSLYYSPIILTVMDGYIYLNSMDTKYKYEIPVYSLNSVISSTKEKEKDNLSISDIFFVVADILNGLNVTSSKSEFSISLSKDLLNYLNPILEDLLGMDIALNNIEIAMSNLTFSTADFNINAEVSLMNMDIKANLMTQTSASNYVSKLTEEDKLEYILTNDFTEHPFAKRVLDILKMVKGITSLDYATTGQGFNLQIPLEIDSGLVKSAQVTGSMGAWIDLEGILNGKELWSSLRFNVDVNIKATTNLFGAKVNIDIKIFYIGDGFIYLIVDGDAIGIKFSIADLLIDVKGSLEDSVASDNEEAKIVYLNDLLNKVINGFTTQTTDNVTTLTLAPSAVEVVHTLWRKVVDLTNEEIAKLNISALTNLINSIINFNMDVTGFEIKYVESSEKILDSLTITLSGYRHNTYTPTSLPITITSQGDLSSNHFDTYLTIAAQDKYTIAKNEIITAKQKMKELGSFTYSEEFYLKAQEVQAYLDNMSEIAKKSFETKKVLDMIGYYETLKTSEEKIKEILISYEETGLEQIIPSDVISCYEACLYFKENQIIFTLDECDSFIKIYNAIAEQELQDFANRILEFTERETYSFSDDAIDIYNYKVDLDELNVEFRDLSDSYKTAFKQFYPTSYQKLVQLIKTYTKESSIFINEQIYSYIAMDMDLEVAQQEYINYQFGEWKKYSLDGYEDYVVWNILTDYIYNMYIASLDLEIGKNLEEGIVAKLIQTIPVLEKEYQKFSEDFQAYFKYDMNKLSEKMEPAKVKYVEEIVALNLKTVFKVDTFSANESYANANYKDYYLFETLPIDIDLMNQAIDVIYYYEMGSLIDISELVGITQEFDSDYFATFKLVYYIYNFIKQIKDSSISKEAIMELVIELEDIEENYYCTYKFEEKKLGFISLGVYQCKETIKHSYFELFSNAEEGSFAKEIYNLYLTKIA